MLDFIAVSKAYGSHVLLQDAGFRVNDQDRIGLVGANGSGKTTLFRLITGKESADSGTIQHKKGLAIGYLPQEIDVFKEGSVLNEVLGGRPDFLEVHLELTDSEARPEHDQNEELERKRAYLHLRYDELGGESVLAEAHEILGGLGFSPTDVQRPLSTFSGGWHMRARLARLLLGHPELLLMDEPTNHLDLPSMIWFENYLRRFSGSFIVVSHDREFLNRTVSRTVELDRGKMTTYNGNYDFYRVRKKEAIELNEKSYRTQQAKIRELEDFIARNRVRKDRARQVQSRIKMLDRIERIEPPTSTGGIGFDFPQPERSGGKVLVFDRLTKRYGDLTVFENLDLTVNRGEKVALIGVNGMGKSTLLKIAAKELEFEGGERAFGSNVTVGYFAQHQLEALDPERSVLEEIMLVTRDETISEIRSLLGAFLFSGDSVEKRVAVLSVGEMSRLAMAKLLMRPANLLLMDEPTNHLDIESREVLEGALQRYQGTLLFASHDRRFIDAVADRVVEMEWGVLRDYIGDYSYYRWKKEQEKDEAESTRDPEVGGSEEGTSLKDTRRDKKRREAELRQALHKELSSLKKRVESIEKAILAEETIVERLEREMADPGLYAAMGSEIGAKGVELARAKKELDSQMEQWEIASTELERAEQRIRARFED